MSNPGRLQATIKHYREQLRAREAQAARALEEAYQHTLRAIQPALDKLHREMAAALADGEKIPLHWLYEQNRLETLKKLITHEIDHYGAMAQMQTGQLQHMAVALGQDAAQALLQSTVPAGVKYAFGVPSPAAIADLVGATQSGSPLADLFAGFGAEAAKGAEQALITGLTNGDNPRKVASALQDALGVSRQRALVISRTTMLDAYRSSNIENFRSNSDVVQQWRWEAAPGACAMCVAMDGELFDLDQELDSHPNCRCVPVPITASWSDILSPLGIDASGLDDTSEEAYQSGPDWFDGQSADIQRGILGPAKFAAYQDGAITLKDLVGVSHSEDWGTSRYEKSLKEALGSKKAKQYYVSRKR